MRCVSEILEECGGHLPHRDHIVRAVTEPEAAGSGSDRQGQCCVQITCWAAAPDGSYQRLVIGERMVQPSEE